MEKILARVGSLLYGMRFTMLFFYVGLVGIIFGILGKFLFETYKLMMTLMFGNLEKIELIIKVLELVDMTMVAQLVWVVALAGVSLGAPSVPSGRPPTSLTRRSGHGSARPASRLSERGCPRGARRVLPSPGTPLDA